MGKSELAGQLDIFGGERYENADYEAFVDKFKPKKTTDDCYTPRNIYEVIAGWVADEYGVKHADMVRPFWPGADYLKADYPDGCCVVDNPPFSMLAQIVRYYQGRGIRFFLFAPTLTLFSTKNADVSYVACGVQITYANGAKVNTSFVTNLDTCRVRSAPRLYKIVERENDINEKALTKTRPKYTYPAHVLTAAAAYKYSHYGIEYRLEKSDFVLIEAMDAKKMMGKTIFGKGFLLTERAAAERAAAERAAAERAAATMWELSERARGIIAALGGEAHGLLAGAWNKTEQNEY